MLKIKIDQMTERRLHPSPDERVLRWDVINIQRVGASTRGLGDVRQAQPAIAA